MNTCKDCHRYPTMGERCIKHWYTANGKTCPDPMPQLPGGGWNVTEAHRRKTEALRQVERNATDAFKQAAMRAVNAVRAERARFTADDVWVKLDGMNVPAPIEPRALGAVLQAAAKLGLIAPTGEWQESVRPQNHARPVRVWEVI